ncbi:MAG: hypothetical protein Q8942_05585 [Bacillota bacterium]|nr:hypothetical protein [Bacillota bacterium]
MIYPTSRPCGMYNQTADMQAPQNFNTIQQAQGLYPTGMQGQGAYPAGMIPAMPSGAPTGPSQLPMPTTTQTSQPGPGTSASPSNQVPQSVQNTMFTPGFLSTQIGKSMRVEFLLGTNGPLVDRTGTLLQVGASYILLRPTGSDDILLCDIYSIRFVTILL